MPDWKIFTGADAPHDGLRSLPAAPPWRFAREQHTLLPPSPPLLSAEEAQRAATFRPTEAMTLAVNAALYLRRPLLITGKPGTGKSTLIAKVAHELQLGPVLRWPVSSRSTVRSGVYEYDAVGRLQAGQEGAPPVQDYLQLGPLGTALMAEGWPRALLIDEIDKSDLDFANDLLNIIEDGDYLIAELARLNQPLATVKTAEQAEAIVHNGRIVCRQFPFIVMTSNGEREFPAPFLRRCIRLDIKPPSVSELADIIDIHLAAHRSSMERGDIDRLIKQFDQSRMQNNDISTDQLLNAVFLTIAMRDSGQRQFDEAELGALRTALMRPIAGPNE